MAIFRHVEFFTTVNYLKDLPPTQAEVAFVGRSNSGKSSAINTLTGQNRLARVSKTPGRTQHINFFNLGHGHYLVDLPGYGYAAVPERVRQHWVSLLGGYLQTRSSLIGLLLIMDIRHPLKPLDYQMLDFFSQTGRPVHILLSKSDKLSRQGQMDTLKAVRHKIEHYAHVSVQLFSSLKKSGVKEVEKTVGQWFAAQAPLDESPETPVG